MKRTVFAIAMALMAIFSTVEIKAQSETEIYLLNAVVEAMNSECESISSQTDGTIKKANAIRAGRNIEINMYLGIEDFSFDDLTKEMKESLVEGLSASFLQGIKENQDNEMAIGLFKSMGTKFIFNIIDVKNGKISKTIDSKDL